MIHNLFLILILTTLIRVALPETGNRESRINHLNRNQRAPHMLENRS